MTDNEIIKALEHIEAFTCCKDCAFYKKCTGKCVITETLNLINRQKAEIEGLSDLLKRHQRHTKSIRILTAETAKKIKAEAYKEFAEGLCEGRVSNDNTVILAKCLLKEMVGENDEQTKKND